MIASSRYDNFKSQNIKSSIVKNLKWMEIENEKKYVLKWKGKNGDFYYLITKEKEDKNTLVNMAEKFESNH